MPHSRRLAPVAAVVLLLTMLAGPAAAAGFYLPTAERVLAELTNESRVDHGVSALPIDAELQAAAREQARLQLAARKMHHNDELGKNVTDWQRIGENVGWAASVGDRWQVADALQTMQLRFMESDGHRANILADDWTHMGVGLAWDNEHTEAYVTVLFKSAESATNTVAPVPASGSVDDLELRVPSTVAVPQASDHDDLELSATESGRVSAPARASTSTSPVGVADRAAAPVGAYDDIALSRSDRAFLAARLVTAPQALRSMVRR